MATLDLPKIGGIYFEVILPFERQKGVPDAVPMGIPSHPSNSLVINVHPLGYRAPGRQLPGAGNPGHRQPRRQILNIRTLSNTRTILRNRR